MEQGTQASAWKHEAQIPGPKTPEGPAEDLPWTRVRLM